MKTNSNTRLTFGTRKGTKIRDLPNTYLQWMVREMWDGDFHNWALAAKKELESRDNDSKFDSLEEQADEFLRDHGIDPRKL